MLAQVATPRVVNAVTSSRIPEALTSVFAAASSSQKVTDSHRVRTCVQPELAAGDTSRVSDAGAFAWMGTGLLWGVGEVRESINALG